MVNISNKMDKTSMLINDQTGTGLNKLSCDCLVTVWFPAGERGQANKAGPFAGGSAAAGSLCLLPMNFS